MIKNELLICSDFLSGAIYRLFVARLKQGNTHSALWTYKILHRWFQIGSKGSTTFQLFFIRLTIFKYQFVICYLIKNPSNNLLLHKSIPPRFVSPQISPRFDCLQIPPRFDSLQIPSRFDSPQILKFIIVLSNITQQTNYKFLVYWFPLYSEINAINTFDLFEIQHTSAKQSASCNLLNVNYMNNYRN